MTFIALIYQVTTAQWWIQGICFPFPGGIPPEGYSIYIQECFNNPQMTTPSFLGDINVPSNPSITLGGIYFNDNISCFNALPNCERVGPICSYLWTPYAINISNQIGYNCIEQ